jgi:hypothetical protein
MISPRPPPIALPVTLLLALTSLGCPPNRPAALQPSADPADVTVVFTEKTPGAPLCPSSVTVAAGKECPVNPDRQPCLSPRRLDWVTFASTPAGMPFTIYFDPFKKGGLDAPKGKGKEQISRDAPLQKAYRYNIVAPGCDILDPIIIVQ